MLNNIDFHLRSLSLKCNRISLIMVILEEQIRTKTPTYSQSINPLLNDAVDKSMSTNLQTITC